MSLLILQMFHRRFANATRVLVFMFQRYDVSQFQGLEHGTHAMLRACAIIWIGNLPWPRFEMA